MEAFWTNNSINPEFLHCKYLTWSQQQYYILQMLLHGTSITFIFVLYLMVIIIFVNGEDNTSIKSCQTIARWLVRHIGWGTISTSVMSLKGSGKIDYLLTCLISTTYI